MTEATLAPPVLSLPDPVIGSEGSVDPLSLARTYERLADRILPAITVRMSRIRFVTAMCVGSLVCRKYEPDAVATDDVTPPWLVFEWLVIEALARSDEDVQGQSIAGLRKVRQCLDSQREVSAAGYLKTPKVFGFTGIFRRLAEHATILDRDLDLDDGGWSLLRAWAADEGLQGWFEDDGAAGSGSGAALRRELTEAVAASMARGHTVSRRASFWQRVAANLLPTRIGRQEREVLLNHVRGTHELTREVVDALIDHGRFVTRDAEPAYLRALARRASPELRGLLEAIDAYEAMCRPITDAFALIRHLATIRRDGMIGAAEFARDRRVTSLVRALGEAVARAGDTALLDLEPDVCRVVDDYREVRDAGALFAAVVAHHERAQRDKPPDGKRSWLEHGRDDAVIVRPAYAIAELVEPDEPADGGARYVHDYRMQTVCRFLRDLRALP